MDKMDKIMEITPLTLGYPPFRELFWVPSEPWTEPWTSHLKTYLGHRGMEENFEEHHPFRSNDGIGVKTISTPKKRVRKHLWNWFVMFVKGIWCGWSISSNPSRMGLTGDHWRDLTIQTWISMFFSIFWILYPRCQRCPPFVTEVDLGGSILLCNCGLFLLVKCWDPHLN